ncbi:leucine-rich_repeat domain-containing protein [Hexamita inflata]|uniref:Leucine-rich repeat domain-containing protein n=1 Tax=Hexamita inflata TaxID=28002 RepID=A0AA86TN13_9EUKA|nr:leucine-rich repeat domain-containing protein [Hexamita inflata]
MMNSSENQYDQEMKTIFADEIDNDTLVIDGNQQIQNFQFVEQLEINKLVINECFRLKFNRVPQNITELLLYNCKLKNLDGIQEMRQLESFNLKQNSLVSDSKEVIDISALSTLTSLTELYLSGNNLCDVSSLRSLLSLKTLDLQKNQISSASSLCKLTNLTRLNLGGNKLTNISALRFLFNLQYLQLWGNQITDIYPLKSLSQISKLNLNSNQIVDVSCLSFMSQLNELHIFKNQIVSIRSLKNLQQLNYVELDYNFITDLSPILDNPAVYDFVTDNQATPNENQIRISNQINAIQETQLIVMKNKQMNYKMKLTKQKLKTVIKKNMKVIMKNHSLFSEKILALVQTGQQEVDQ